MGDEHLKQLEASLGRKGWTIIAREGEIDWKYAGAWEIQRSLKKKPIRLLFNAMDGLGSNTVRELPSAWCCEVEGIDGVSLYFSKLRNFNPKLEAFLIDLDGLENERTEL